MTYLHIVIIHRLYNLEHTLSTKYTLPIQSYQLYQCNHNAPLYVTTARLEQEAINLARRIAHQAELQAIAEAELLQETLRQQQREDQAKVIQHACRNFVARVQRARLRDR